MFDGLVAFAMDRWRHDCGARRVRIISRPGSPMSEGRFDLSTFRSERTNEASTLTITPKRSSSRDVELADELGLIVETSLTKPKLKDLIVKSPDYIEDDVKREYEEKLRREEREYELEKLRIQAEKNANTMNNPENVQAPKVIHEIFHKFNMKDDISLNLTLFERHAELTFLPKKDWRKIELDGEEYSLTWHAVLTPSLEFHAVIGSDILQQASVCFYKESVQFRKHEDKNCFLQMQVYEAEVKDEIVVQHVTNPQIRRELFELIPNYEPKKTK
ncbi:peptidase A2 domain-containing protein [Trichonephila clavipes]|uniref:Peptidase A2 domain-containing protein n=1 Tax=Trichonephila clavipes TaxID=2585209 RepID=A0A8X6RQF8_TRICX|nr:peptidase A2 domain-containing protein [Trichonephila clavipes]